MDHEPPCVTADTEATMPMSAPASGEACTDSAEPADSTGDLSTACLAQLMVPPDSVRRRSAEHCSTSARPDSTAQIHPCITSMSDDGIQASSDRPVSDSPELQRSPWKQRHAVFHQGIAEAPTAMHADAPPPQKNPHLPLSTQSSSRVLQGVHSMRTTIAATAASSSTLTSVLTATRRVFSTALWFAVLLFSLWLWGGMFLWLAAAGVWFLSRWAVAAASRQASRRLLHGRTVLLRSATRAVLRLLVSAQHTLTTAAHRAVATCQRALNTAGAKAGGARRRIAGLAGWISAVASQVWAVCACVAACAVRTVTWCAVRAARACMYVVGVVRAAVGIAIGVTLWWTCMWLSALCWAGFLAHEAATTAQSAAVAVVAPLVRFTAPYARPAAWKA